MQRRPAHCDRGRWLAHAIVNPLRWLECELDEADLWPRYYFSLKRGMLECADWLAARKLIAHSTQIALPSEELLRD